TSLLCHTARHRSALPVVRIHQLLSIAWEWLRRNSNSWCAWTVRRLQGARLRYPDPVRWKMSFTAVTDTGPKWPGQQSVVGRLEVVVALLAFAVGFLGYAGLQLGALKGTEVAHPRALATGIAQDFLDRILVNPDGDYVDADLWSDAYPDLDEPKGWKSCI